MFRRDASRKGGTHAKLNPIVTPKAPADPKIHIMSSGDDGTDAPSSGSGAMLMNQPIVIDSGTATIKAGFAGGSKPKVGWLVYDFYVGFLTVSTYFHWHSLLKMLERC